MKEEKEMAQAFKNFLQNIETVYHFNGQQVVTINRDNATGKCYCLITIIGNENGKKIKTAIGATYEDDYNCTNGKWMVGNFEWQNKNEIKS